MADASDILSQYADPRRVLRNPLMDTILQQYQHDPYELPKPEPKYTGEARNLPERPGDPFASRIAPDFSPALAGDAIGRLLADTYTKGREGDWGNLEYPALLAAVLPVPGTKRGPSFSLSPNRAFGHDELGRPRFNYAVLKNGEKIGSATGHVAGDTAFLSWLGATGRENTLGANGLRQLRDALRQEFPDVTTFSGDRSSGARHGPAAAPDRPRRARDLRFGDEPYDWYNPRHQASQYVHEAGGLEAAVAQAAKDAGELKAARDPQKEFGYHPKEVDAILKTYDYLKSGEPVPQWPDPDRARVRW